MVFLNTVATIFYGAALYCLILDDNVPRVISASAAVVLFFAMAVTGILIR